MRNDISDNFTWDKMVETLISIFCMLTIYKKESQNYTPSPNFILYITTQHFQCGILNWSSNFCMFSSFSLSCLTLSRQSAGESEQANSVARAAHFAFESKTASSRDATVVSMPEPQLPPPVSENGLNPVFDFGVKIWSIPPVPASYSKQQSGNKRYMCP